MIGEFRDFINKGNFVDIAVAFVIGVAFGAVVTTLVSRIVSPLIAMIFNVPDLSGIWMFGKIDEVTGLQSGSVGAFLAALLNFVVIAFVMFLVVRTYNRHRTPETVADAEELVLLREIRDHLAEPQRVIVLPETAPVAVVPPLADATGESPAPTPS